MSGFDPLRTFDELGTMLEMARYLKKPVVVDAVQWFNHGDQPAVLAGTARDTMSYIDTLEGPLG